MNSISLLCTSPKDNRHLTFRGKANYAKSENHYLSKGKRLRQISERVTTTGGVVTPAALESMSVAVRIASSSTTRAMKFEM